MSVMFDRRLFITAIQLLYSAFSTLTFSDTSRDSVRLLYQRNMNLRPIVQVCLETFKFRMDELRLSTLSRRGIMNISLPIHLPTVSD